MTAQKTEREEALEPCPFCGGTPTMLDAGDDIVFIACPSGSSCRGSELLIGFKAEKKSKAIAAWNRRAPSKAEGEMREALEALLEALKQIVRVVDDGGSFDPMSSPSMTKARAAILKAEGK